MLSRRDLGFAVSLGPLTAKSCLTLVSRDRRGRQTSRRPRRAPVTGSIHVLSPVRGDTRRALGHVWDGTQALRTRGELERAPSQPASPLRPAHEAGPASIDHSQLADVEDHERGPPSLQSMEDALEERHAQSRQLTAQTHGHRVVLSRDRRPQARRGPNHRPRRRRRNVLDAPRRIAHRRWCRARERECAQGSPGRPCPRVPSARPPPCAARSVLPGSSGRSLASALKT
jgi:hypothetical protein